MASVSISCPSCSANYWVVR
ncbi:IS1 family transposase, partial [Escherichia coli]